MADDGSHGNPDEIDLGGGAFVAVDNIEEPFVIVQIEFYCSGCNEMDVQKIEVERTWRIGTDLIIEVKQGSFRCTGCSKAHTVLVKKEGEEIHQAEKWDRGTIKNSYRRRNQ